MTACPICNNSQSTVVYKSVEGFNIDRTFSLDKCSYCQTIYTSPQLTKGELSDYYNREELAINGEYGSAPIDSYLKNKRPIWISAGYPQRLKEILSFRPKAKQVIDIGCGAGFFVDYLKSEGMASTGLEISDWGYSVGSGKLKLNVLQATLNDIDLGSKQRFEVATLYDVLEHSPQPSEDLQRLNNIMVKEGLAVINVPNFGSLASRLAGPGWNKLIPPNHTVHFTIDSIKKLVESSGFKIVRLSTNNGRADELSGEILVSLWRLIGIFSPRIANAYLKKDKPISQNKELAVYLVKATKTLGRKVPIIGYLIRPLLTLFRLGEGIHIVAVKAKE